jgi:hypothetical protein
VLSFLTPCKQTKARSKRKLHGVKPADNGSMKLSLGFFSPGTKGFRIAWEQTSVRPSHQVPVLKGVPTQYKMSFNLPSSVGSDLEFCRKQSDRDWGKITGVGV